MPRGDVRSISPRKARSGQASVSGNTLTEVFIHHAMQVRRLSDGTLSRQVRLIVILPVFVSPPLPSPPAVLPGSRLLAEPSVVSYAAHSGIPFPDARANPPSLDMIGLWPL